VPKLKQSADSYQENLSETTKMYTIFLLINDTRSNRVATCNNSAF